MVQDQLVDYISTQMKLGASREAVKTALIGAGWQAGDVDDSFKKVEGGAAQPAKPAGGPAAMSSPASNQAIGGGVAARPAATSGAGGSSANAFFGKNPAAAQGSSGPQVIRMSDLVSTTDAPLATASKTMPSMMAKKDLGAPASMSSAAPSKSKLSLIVMIVGIVLILVLGGLAGYFYVQNSTLSSQIASINGQSASVASQITSLNSQVNALTASSTANATAMAGLTSANLELTKELSFYAVPAGSAATTSQISVTGSLGINSKTFFITASFGGKLMISNSRDPKAITILAPLVGTSTQLTGTYVPGSDSMTVTAVNGTSL